ncbi:hypothetical protein [Salinicola salarius]|uniref:hypothetical protein n=1 Tax=Salinicola salarius TaxID=430457 RepID=UPI00117B8F12|nr:hypothetical protein [Salinicola salarius]
MDKFSEERKILELTKPLLVELYGHFNIVPEQADRPDAAIVLDATGGKIGIEITSVDGQEIQQYFNDEKFGKDFKLEQVGELIASGRHSNRPDKKASISFPNSYIVSGILKKI